MQGPDERILSIMNAHIENSNQTIALVTQSLQTIQIQQNNLATLMRSLIPVQNEPHSTIPITMTFHDFSFADISNSSTNITSSGVANDNYTPNNIITNIVGILDNLTSTHATNATTGVSDISSVTQPLTFGSIHEPSALVCPISLEPFQYDDEVLRIIYCGHYFKRNSLLSWFSRSSRCPVCRHDVISHEAN